MLGITGWEQQVLDLEPGEELIFEAESKRYHYWIVLEGWAYATVESVSIDLEPGQVINLMPYSRASLKNKSTVKLKVLATSMEIIKKKV
mgnify:CR=1 FL=1